MRIVPKHFLMIWRLLTSHEQRLAYGVLGVMVLASISSVLMVGSIMPFLFVLSNPEIVETHPFFQYFSAVLKTDDFRVLVGVLAALVFLAIVVSNGIGALRVYVLSRYIQMRALSLSRRMFELQMRQPYEIFANTKASIFVRRSVTEPVNAVGGYLLPFGEAVAASITAFFMVSFLAWYDFKTTASVLVFFTVSYLILNLIVGNRLKVLGQKKVAAATLRGQVMQEVIRCYRDIRMSGQEDEFLKRFSVHSGDALRPLIMAQFWSQFPKYWIQTLFFGGIVFACAFFIIFAGEESRQAFFETLPTVGLFVLAGQRILPEIQLIYNSRNKMVFGSASVDAFMEGYRMAKDYKKTNLTYEKMPFSKKIVLKGIQYMYPESSSGIVKPLNLTIERGERIGIVGESGSGKSTLAGILMGLILPSSGQFLVDEESVSDDNIGSWRRSVAQVPQEVMLLATSLRSNVAIGVSEKEISDERVWSALEKANLDVWARDLPDGLDTQIMSGASKISGGQKQRIGLARSFYTDADFLILDEATSALDENTEQAILETLDQQLDGKTSVAIAHRLSTLKSCSRIIEMSNGEVVFDGSWVEFSKHRGL